MKLKGQQGVSWKSRLAEPPFQMSLCVCWCGRLCVPCSLA